MAQIPQAFPQIPNNAIASYDYVDVADGTGKQVFYFMSEDSSKMLVGQPTHTILKELRLTNNFTSAGEVSGPFTYSLSPFNLPRTIKGEALVEAGFDVQVNSGPQFSGSFIFQIDKNDVGLYSGSTAEKSYSGSNVSGSIVLKISITNPVHFARGDVLGIKYWVFGKSSGTANVTNTIGTSPLDEDGAVIQPSINQGETTITKISIPFRLDDVA